MLKNLGFELAQGVNVPTGASRMKIVYVNDQLLPADESDTEQFMLTVAALGSAGASVRLAIPQRGRSRTPSLSELISYYCITPSFGIDLVHSLFPSRRVIEKIAHPIALFARRHTKTADVIYSRNLATIVLGLVMTRAAVVYETYRPWPQQLPILNPLFKIIAKRPRFLGIITHSRLAARSFRSIGTPSEKLLVAYNGCSPTRMSPSMDKAEARSLIGFESDQPLVVYTGHVSEGKGLEMVLDMARSMPETQFLIVGSTGRTSIERRAEEIRNMNIVPWQPFECIRPYLYAADILLIPPTSRPLVREGHTVLPLKTFLYMAAGRAILAPSTPDICEILKDGSSACLVPPDELPAAVGALRRLLDNPGRMEKLARHARRDALEYTYDRRAKRILSFLENRLGGA
jgi:glycosyltransferase involved in cell wall biosynthesis